LRSFSYDYGVFWFGLRFHWIYLKDNKVFHKLSQDRFYQFNQTYLRDNIREILVRNGQVSIFLHGYLVKQYGQPKVKKVVFDTDNFKSMTFTPFAPSGYSMIMYPPYSFQKKRTYTNSNFLFKPKFNHLYKIATLHKIDFSSLDGMNYDIEFFSGTFTHHEKNIKSLDYSHSFNVDIIQSQHTYEAYQDVEYSGEYFKIVFISDRLLPQYLKNFQLYNIVKGYHKVLDIDYYLSCIDEANKRGLL